MIKIKFNNSTIELMTTREDIYTELENMKVQVCRELQSESLHSTEFNNELFKLLTRLEFELDDHKLPLMTDDWYFAITIDNHHACIDLRHLYNTDNYDGYDESYTLISIPVTTYSSIEYAQLLNINEVTVRQWIRRGKLRSVYKIGNDWRIPVLTDKPKRGFTNITYHNQKAYINLSQFGCFATNPGTIEIWKTETSGEYQLITDGVPAFNILHEQDREKLEHMLIESGITNSDNLFLGYPAGEEPDHRTITLKTGGMRD